MTWATSGFENAMLTVALWLLPERTLTDVAAPAVFVSVKLAAVATPAVAAVTR